MKKRQDFNPFMKDKLHYLVSNKVPKFNLAALKGFEVPVNF